MSEKEEPEEWVQLTAEEKKREGEAPKQCESEFQIVFENKYLWLEVYSYQAKSRMASNMKDEHATGPDGNQDFSISEGVFDKDGLHSSILMKNIPVDWDEDKIGYWMNQAIKDMIMRNYSSRETLNLQSQIIVEPTPEDCKLQLRE